MPGRFYHNSDGFLMLGIQNVCVVEPILTFCKSNLTEFVMILVSPPHSLGHSGKAATIRESNHGSGVCKENYA